MQIGDKSRIFQAKSINYIARNIEESYGGEKSVM